MVTLGSLARAVGPDHFSPELAGRCLARGLEVARTAHAQEPGTRRGAFSMFGSLATVAGAELGGGVLAGVVEELLLTVQSTQGMVIEEAGADNNENTHKEEAAISVQNSYAEEKVSALVALNHLSATCGEVFHPWLDQCYREVSHLLNFPHYDVRAAAIEAWSVSNVE